MSELSAVEIKVTADVVHRFLASREATPGRVLIKKFKSIDTPQKLARWTVLKPLDNNKYLPKALAFHYCGDQEAFLLAKQSIELITNVLKEMFDLCDEDNKWFTVQDLENQSRTMFSAVDSKKIWLGLYLADEFRVLAGWQPGTNSSEISSFHINDHVVEIEKHEALWDQFVLSQTTWIRRQIEGFPSISHDMDFQNDEPITIQNSKKVFLVHGHNDEVKDAAARFLRDLGLDVVILHEKPNEGKTIVEKFETHSDVAFAVVLLTPDDLGASTKEPDKAKKRARQNVILELGYFIGKLGRKRVCPVYVQGVELPSDIHGVLYVPYDEGGTWRSQLLKEITAAGIPVKSRSPEEDRKDANTSSAATVSETTYRATPNSS